MLGRTEYTYTPIKKLTRSNSYALINYVTLPTSDLLLMLTRLPSLFYYRHVHIPQRFCYSKREYLRYKRRESKYNYMINKYDIYNQLIL